MMSGWSGNRFCEIVWQYFENGKLAGKHGFAGFWDKPNEQMAFDVDPDSLELINATSYTPSHGYEFNIPIEKMIWCLHAPQRNDPHGVGDWRACYKHWFRLENNLKFWAIALERWGAPVLLLKYPAGNKEALLDANRAAGNIRQGSNAVIPNNVEYELINAPAGVFSAMKESAEYDSREMALAIHANILSTGEGEHGSTSAGAKEHGAVGSTIYDAFSIGIENAYNQQLVHRFVRYNYGDKALELIPQLRLRKRNTQDLAVVAQVISILHSVGNLPSRSKVIRDQLGWPALTEEEMQELDEEKKANEEAQQQANDMKQQGLRSLHDLKQKNPDAPRLDDKTTAGAAGFSDARMDQLVSDLTSAILIQRKYPQLIKRLAQEAQW
jgi:phage gp29-like protein